MNENIKALLIRLPIAAIAGDIDNRLASRGFAEKPTLIRMVVTTATNLAMDWSSYYVEKTVDDFENRN